MHFVTNRKRLQDAIDVTSDDFRRSYPNLRREPFLRLEASGDRVKLTGRVVEADLPARVLIPGVLFIEIFPITWALWRMPPREDVEVRVDLGRIRVGGITVRPVSEDDVWLYEDPRQAPDRSPKELECAARQVEEAAERAWASYHSKKAEWKAAKARAKAAQREADKARERAESAEESAILPFGPVIEAEGLVEIETDLTID